MSLAACGQDDGDEGSASADTSSGELSGDPIKINVTYPETGPYTFTEVGVAARAAIKAVNEDGGINGRPLELHVCDVASATDPNPVTQCIREMTADREIVADIGHYGGFGELLAPIADQAGLAAIAPVPIGQSQMSLPTSFPLMGEEKGGFGSALVDHGSKAPGLVFIDTPSGQATEAYINSFLEAGRDVKELVVTQPAPVTATDLSPQVAALCEADAVAMSVAPTQVAQFLTAHEQGSCSDQTLAVGALAVTPKDLANLGDKADGLVIVGGLPFAEGDTEGAALFREQIQAEDPKAALTEPALNAWMGIWAFALEARKMDGDITRESVLEHWQGLDTLEVFDLLPPEMSLQEGSDEVDRPQLFNHWLQYAKVEGGKIVDSGDGWVDLLP